MESGKIDTGRNLLAEGARIGVFWEAGLSGHWEICWVWGRERMQKKEKVKGDCHERMKGMRDKKLE